MSRARKRRKVIRWARYFNRYVHHSDVRVGGDSAVNAIFSRSTVGRTFSFVRRQRKIR